MPGVTTGHASERRRTGPAPLWQDARMGVRRFAGLSSLGLAAALLLAVVPALAQIRIGETAVVEFASPEEASAILGRVDDYVSRMGRFDRMLRLKTGNEVTQPQFLEFVTGNVLPWNVAERARMAALVATLALRLKELQAPLPARVLLVKTTGREEAGVAHTRANAIMLSAQSLAATDAELTALLAHELFHVMTRHDAAFRARAYRSIGFQLCPEIVLPEALARLRITNPDAPLHDAFIEVVAGGETLPVMPILLSRSETFDAAVGEDITDYWMLRLLALRPSARPGGMDPLLRDGEPVLFSVPEVSGFFERVGSNTGYIIHPEEILADNLALMLSGQSVNNPEVLRRLREVFNGGPAP